MNNNIILEPCNRCCSSSGKLIKNNNETYIVQCENCSFTEDLEVWQLRGWRSILKYPPTFSGVIFVYGKNIGRTIAQWSSITKTCNNAEATHWLRTPDPTKQINM